MITHLESIYWDCINSKYDSLTGKIDNKLYLDVLSALGNLTGVKIDEFGCGTGNLTSKLSKTGAIIRAIDCSSSAISIAQNKIENKTNVTFFLMDFYNEQPQNYHPDKIVVCRSLYNKDLSSSLGMLSEHLGYKGTVVIAHPVKNLFDSIMPQIDKHRKFSFNQMMKASARMANFMKITSYSLFSADDFEKVGRQHFDTVEVQVAAYGTNHIIKLSKG